MVRVEAEWTARTQRRRHGCAMFSARASEGRHSRSSWGSLAGLATGWLVAVPYRALAVLGLPDLFGRTTGSVTVAKIEAVAIWTEMLQSTLAASAGLSQAIVATCAAGSPADPGKRAGWLRSWRRAPSRERPCCDSPTKSADPERRPRGVRPLAVVSVERTAAGGAADRAGRIDP